MGLKNWITTCRRVKLEPYLTFNSKWNKDLNMRSETVKLLEENIGKMLFDIDLCSDFLYMTPKA